MTQQSLNLRRVSWRIAQLVYAFCQLHNEFHMADLVRFVLVSEPDTAPDSPSRILRDLRRKGLISYEVVSRSASLYRMVQA